ncbi:hypothetical protein ACFW9F_07510 [Streptomyces sp. NPDC059506]|uniref:hypothetical protein n=1 Tax=Streptomyces sp. NPDC059506 TaxID=3347751 RepID=UPI003688DA26
MSFFAIVSVVHPVFSSVTACRAAVSALASAQHAITADDLGRALYGPGVPDWPVIYRLTLALHSLPAHTQPLWRRARAAAENDFTATFT